MSLKKKNLIISVILLGVLLIAVFSSNVLAVNEPLSFNFSRFSNN